MSDGPSVTGATLIEPHLLKNSAIWRQPVPDVVVDIVGIAFPGPEINHPGIRIDGQKIAPHVVGRRHAAPG